jgi:hypothetical protein
LVSGCSSASDHLITQETFWRPIGFKASNSTEAVGWLLRASWAMNCAPEGMFSFGGNGVWRTGLVGQEVGEEVDGLAKGAAGGQHHEVDGVEVLLASEAASDVRSGVDGS